MQALVRPFHYAIVDEVDSVLIDDCRNPFILSARAETFNTDRFVVAAKVCACLSATKLASLQQCVLAAHMSFDKRDWVHSAWPYGL